MNKENPRKWFLNACLNNEAFIFIGKARWLDFDKIVVIIWHLSGTFHLRSVLLLLN